MPSDDDTGESKLPEPTTVPTTVPTTTQAPETLRRAPTGRRGPRTDRVLGRAGPRGCAADRRQQSRTSSQASQVRPTINHQLPPHRPPCPGARVPSPAVSQTIASDCGDVLVAIENGAVRIVSITARPGYESQVSDDGPISIEIVLRAADDTCELHAELKSGGLDVDVQNSTADR